VERGASSVRGAPAVRWERLRLQGFGRHRDLRLTIPAGVATWVAPNEAGKSTAVLGLVATVWGLPHLQETAGFAWGRFRAFAGGPHRGEATLWRDGERYTVTRAFDTHRVRVVRHGAVGDEEVLEAEHNPNARREASAYLPWLRATLGIDDAALVLATFVVAQGDLGGPPHRLGRQVQALLAGAGGGTAHEASARLEAALRATTRRVKGLAPGLTRDGRQDQALELAETRLHELEARWAAGRDEADAFVRLQAAASEAGERARAAAAEARRRRAAAEAQRAWVDLREAAGRSARRARELDRAWAEARALDDEVASARAALEAVHPALAGVVAGGFEERVAAWGSAEAAVEVQRRRLDAAREARHGALAAAQAAVAAALAREHALEAADPDVRFAWPDAGRPAPDGPPAVGTAVAACAAAEAAARRWRAGLDAVRRERARADVAAADLAGVAPLAGLEADDRAALRGYREEVAAWAARLGEVEAAWQGWRARLDEADERFGDVATLDPDAAADLVAFARAEERGDGGVFWRAVVPAAAAGAAGAAAVAAGWSSWWVVLVCAVVWGGAFGAWPRRPALRRARRRLDARVAAGAAALAGDDDRRRELARRWEAYEVRRDELARFAAGERAAAARRAEVLAGAAAFRARWEPWREALIAVGHDEDVDLGAANERFGRARAELAEAAERAAAAARSLGVEDPSTLADEAPAARSGPDGARALAWGVAQGALDAHADVAALDGWLGRLSAATWAAWRAASTLADEAAVERRRAREARMSAEEEAVRVARDHERAVLQEERALATARAAREDARAAAWAGMAEGVAEGDAAPRFGTAPRFGALDTPADPAGLRRAWRERSEAVARVRAAAERLDAHLRAVAADDLPALGSAAETAGLEASQAMRSWRELVGDHPSLPPAELAAATAHDRPAGVDGRRAPSGRDAIEAAFAATRTAAEEAERHADAAEQGALLAREGLARAQGGDPIDVASVELEIEEARAEVERFALERDALALAATELAAAAEGYRAGHARRLAAAAGAELAGFGGVAGRRVRLDDDLRAEVVEADGRALAVDQLSQGARDQLALALRFAVADLMADDVALPLVLDDPFLNWDAERAAAAARSLQAAAARGRQVWLLSHRAEIAEWGEPVGVEAG